MGSASVGQAHVATLREGSVPVVVKVQYPEAYDVFRADLDCILFIVKYARPEALELAKKYCEGYLKELDFLAEVRNLEETYDAVMPVFGKVVAIPLVYRKYSSKRVVTMEYLNGPKLDTEVMRSLKAAGIDVATGGFKAWMKQMQKERNDHFSEDNVGSMFGLPTSTTGDVPSTTPQLTMIRWVGQFVDVFWLIRTLEEAARAVLGFTAQVVETTWGGTSWTKQTLMWMEQSRVTAKVELLLSTLLRVHGFEIFVTKLYNADPHPGEENTQSHPTVCI